ncbi:hypothetical protein G3623_004031 [Salmonella enterica]|nr:hypothetical protein [Salmonella enterica]
MTQTTAQAITVDINPHSASDSGAGDIIPSVPVERIVALRESGVSCFLDGQKHHTPRKIKILLI